VDGVSPQLSDDAGGLPQDLVRHGVGTDVARSAAPGDAAPTPGSSGTVGPRVSGPHLSGSPGFTPPPIDWRWVGDEAEFMCS
jgi:hypothetical protein